jgi:hypothetical protein
MGPKEQVKAVNELSKSKGWAVIRQVMEQEVLQAAMAIAETANMPLDEINFRRGSIWAANRMLELPDRLRMKLESEAALLDVDDRKKANQE